MADARTRQLERLAERETTPQSVAELLGAKAKEGADDDELSGLLRRFPTDIHAVLSLSRLSEDRKVLLEVRIMIEGQMTFALENAIQPNQESDAPLPSREAILASVMRTLTPAQAQEILQFNEAKLVITPVTSVERYRDELNRASQTMEGYQAPYLSEFTQGHLNAQANQAQVEGNKIKKWRFVITEGAQTFPIPEWDDGQKTHQQRRGFFRNGPKKKVKGPGSKGMSILDCPSYIALMYQGLRQGKPIDCKNEGDSRNRNAKKNTRQYTLLNEIDEVGRVGVGGWYIFDWRVDLFGNSLANQDAAARLRSAVVGDIEI